MTEAADSRRCAWCEASAPADASHCPKCGAALAQREDLGGLQIAGLTAVHPELAAAADRPLHLAGPSTTQGAASGLIAAAALPGPAALAVGAGIAALAAAEYLGAPGSGLAAPELDAVGRPGESALRMAERLAAAEREGANTSPDDGGDAASGG